MSGKKILISYSRRDKEYIAKLVDALRQQNFEVWFDNNIRTGTDWDDTIESEIRKADAIVLVLSETSVASENVKDEVSYAIGLDKLIVPIKIEECEVPMRLARKQFVDFTTMGAEAGFERLVQDLHLGLNESQTAVAKGTFKPPKTTPNGAPVVVSTKSKIKNYLIGGVVSIVLFVFFIVQCTGDETEETVPANQAWQVATDNHTVKSYLNYIYEHGTSDVYYKAATDSIENLMLYEAMALYGDTEQRYFVKNLYTDLNGRVVFVEDDDAIPKKGDIITALTAVQLYGTTTFEPVDGLMLEPGVKAKVISTRQDDEGNVYIILNYPES